jgi:hypothetical protein
MTVDANNWIQRASHTRGVLACWVRLPDGQSAARAFHGSIASQQVEEAFLGIADALPHLQQSSPGPHRLRWAFEKGQILGIVFPGGPMAGLLVNPNLSTPEVIERLLADVPLA